jgi:vancomycin resistance protein VanJ
MLTLLSVGYLVFLVCAYGAFKWIGEHNLILSLAVYAPPQLYLLPALALAFLSMCARRRIFWLNLFSVIFVFMTFLKYRSASPEEPKGKVLSLISNNIGGRKTRTVWPFLAEEKPDVIVYQDAWHHGRNLSKENPGRFVASHGQFVIVSKYEIKASGPIRDLTYRHNYVAAWFEIDFHGTPIVIYNIHLPTPRPDLLRLRGRGFLVELAGGQGIYSAEVRDQYRQSLEDRAKLARELLAWLENERRPFILAGDFNAPEVSSTYSSFANKYTDAFVERGEGFGFTFPSITRNPVSLFGPWLRLDYVFADKHWQPIYCRVEPRQPAEHRAVSARFEFIEKQ